MQRWKGSVHSSTAVANNNTSASGIWTPSEAAQAKQAGNWPSAGTGGSIALNGTNQYLTAIAAQSPPTLGNNLFTIEMFVRFAALPASASLASLCNQQGDFRFFFHGNATPGNGILSIWQGASTKWVTSASGIVANTWYHICAMRSNTGATTTVCNIYVNGVKLAKTTDTTTSVTYTSTGMIIGSETTQYYINGNVTNYRYVNGTAVYTVSGFTPPTAPLTNITNTKLLLLASTSGTFTNDSSTANAGGPYTVTNVGGATYSALTPF